MGWGEMTALEAACARSGWGLHRRSDQDRPHGSTEEGSEAADSMGCGSGREDRQPVQRKCLKVGCSEPSPYATRTATHAERTAQERRSSAVYGVRDT